MRYTDRGSVGRTAVARGVGWRCGPQPSMMVTFGEVVDLGTHLHRPTIRQKKKKCNSISMLQAVGSIEKTKQFELALNNFSRSLQPYRPTIFYLVLHSAIFGHASSQISR